jgi:uncharacterized glyoxalase superfamily protein PhnB
MPDPVDPLEALRSFTAPRAPRPEFATALRRRLEAALDPDGATSRVPEPTEVPAVATPTIVQSPLSPYLMIAGAARAIDWYRDVFGAIETTRFVGDDGRIGHAEIEIGGAQVLLADEYPEIDLVGPTSLGGTPVSLYLKVADVDHSYRRAIDAGAAGVREPSDQGHGNRNATLVDPFGHRWMLTQPIDSARAAAAERERGIGGDGSTWTITGRAPVEPGYLAMRTGDLDRARAFYGALFGWEIEAGNVDGGGHVANTTFPMGFAPPSADEGAEVTVYFRVDDIATYVARVVELGGQVLGTNAYASGGGAECIDDQGRRFDLWQPAPGY